MRKLIFSANNDGVMFDTEKNAPIETKRTLYIRELIKITEPTEVITESQVFTAPADSYVFTIGNWDEANQKYFINAANITDASLIYDLDEMNKATTLSFMAESSITVEEENKAEEIK